MTTVWIVGSTGRGAGSYHTDRDCPHLQRGASVYKKDLAQLAGHYEICKTCAGTARKPIPDNPNQDTAPSAPPGTVGPNVDLGVVWTPTRGFVDL